MANVNFSNQQVPAQSQKPSVAKAPYSLSSRWTMGREDNKFRFSRTGEPLITWWINPSECQWRVGTRTHIEKIGAGAIHHEWPQTEMGGVGGFSKSRFDQPTLSLTFQSGIINAGGYEDLFNKKIDLKQVPKGLGNFYDFLELLDISNMSADDRPNYVNIMYHSALFGERGIHLQGFFSEEGVSWTDSAENPNQITSWGASFIVYNSTPRLNSLRECFRTLGIATR